MQRLLYWAVRRRPLKIAVLLAVFVIFTLLLGFFVHRSMDEQPSAMQPLPDGWYYYNEAGEKIDITLPTTLTLSKVQPLTLYHSNLPSQAGLTISTRAAVYTPIISVGRIIVYQYNDSLFPRNAPMKSKLYCDATMPFNTENVPLSITYYSDSPVYYLPPVYIGYTSRLLPARIIDSALSIFLAALMFSLGLVSFGLFVFLRRRKVEEPRFFDATLFLVITGLWALLDSGIFQEYQSIYALAYLVSFYAFMLFSVPMLRFIQHTDEMEKYPVLMLFQLLLCLNAVVQGILYLGFHIDFITMLPFTQLLMAASSFSAIYALYREYRIGRSAAVRDVLVAISILSITGVATVLIYWLLSYSYYVSVFQIGILIFIVLLLKSIAAGWLKSYYLRQELRRYRQMSTEDELTGLKNRRAFDRCLEAIERGGEPLQNAALLFLDLNYLKQTNDNFGHESGDALIIAAAGTIKAVFSAYGRCFRIGGDEFCVVLVNPKIEVQRLLAELDEAIALYNRSSAHPLSIARGISYLFGKDGSRKSMSDWMHEADLAMYRDKQARKSTEPFSPAT